MNWPERLLGIKRSSAWLNRLLAAAKASEIHSTPTVKVTRTPRGTLLEATGLGGGGTYHEFKLCRNGQTVTIHIDSQEDPATLEDDEV